MMTFYAAVGGYRIKNEHGHKVPYIQKLGKLYPISIPEFVIWSTLLWEVMTYPELKRFYQEQIGALPDKTPDFDELLDMLIRRKLIICGIGYTGHDALYNMLSDAFVIPCRLSSGRKLLSILRLLHQGKISFSDSCKLLKLPKFSEAEDRVMNLVEQTPLSTSEIIRCFERGVKDVSTAAKVISGIYPESCQSAIANEEFLSPQSTAVLQAVSNLYLGRKVILEVL